MSVPKDLLEYSICSMYRDGVSLRALEVAFDKSDEEIAGVLLREGAAELLPGESRDAFIARMRNDVKHQAA